MSTLSRIVRAANWKYALGETALIFIGITLALAANNWYENWQDRIEEKEILRQMIVGLSADLANTPGQNQHGHVSRPAFTLMKDSARAYRKAAHLITSDLD